VGAWLVSAGASGVLGQGECQRRPLGGGSS